MQIANFKSLSNELKGDLYETIAVYKCAYKVDDLQKGQGDELPQNLTDFYQIAPRFELKWQARELKNGDSPIQGLANILKPEQVLSDWAGIVYFKDQDHYDYMEHFKIVDFFADEACVGYVHDEQKVDYMQYLDLGAQEPQPLDLNFAGYLELLLACRGYAYWQLVILHLRNGSGHENKVEEFKTFMPQLFPDFKWEDFVALYHKVRIK